MRYKIIGLDPGKHHDSFGLVQIEVDTTTKSIRVTGAKQWNSMSYLQVESEIGVIYDKSKIDYIIIERNNTGEHVLEVLKNKMHLPVIGVTMSKSIKDPSKKHSGRVIDKNDMVQYMAHLISEEKLVFPKFPKSLDMQELKRQMAVFAAHKTEAGNISYHADGNEHDDLVMALLLSCYLAREKYLREGSPVVAVSKPKSSFPLDPWSYSGSNYAIHYPS